MVVSCEEVWREISNYLEGEVDPGLRAAMDEHFVDASAVRQCSMVRATWSSYMATSECSRCHWDSATVCTAGWKRKWLGLQTEKLYRLDGARRPQYWSPAASKWRVHPCSAEPGLRSEHSQPGRGVPPDMMVVVATDGKTFHVAGCPFIHDKQTADNLRPRSSAGGLHALRALHEEVSESPDLYN